MYEPFNRIPDELVSEISSYNDLPATRLTSRRFESINRKRYCDRAQFISQDEIENIGGDRCTYFYVGNIYSKTYIAALVLNGRKSYYTIEGTLYGVSLANDKSYIPSFDDQEPAEKTIDLFNRYEILLSRDCESIQKNYALNLTLATLEDNYATRHGYLLQRAILYVYLLTNARVMKLDLEAESAGIDLSAKFRLDLEIITFDIYENEKSDAEKKIRGMEYDIDELYRIIKNALMNYQNSYTMI